MSDLQGWKHVRRRASETRTRLALPLTFFPAFGAQRLVPTARAQFNRQASPWPCTKTGCLPFRQRAQHASEIGATLGVYLNPHVPEQRQAHLEFVQ